MLVWKVTQNYIKQYVLELSEPTLYSLENCTLSCVVTVHLVDALRGSTELWSVNISMMLKHRIADNQRQKNFNYIQALAKVMGKPPATEAFRLQQGSKTGAWISVKSSRVNSIDIGAQACSDALLL